MKREVLTSTNAPLSLFSMYTYHHQQSLSKNQFAPNQHFSLSLSTFFSSFLFSLLACYSKSLIPYSPLKSPLIPPHLPSLIPPEKEPLYSFWYLYHLVKLDLSLSCSYTCFLFHKRTIFSAKRNNNKFSMEMSFSLRHCLVLFVSFLFYSGM